MRSNGGYYQINLEEELGDITTLSNKNDIKQIIDVCENLTENFGNKPVIISFIGYGVRYVLFASYSVALYDVKFWYESTELCNLKIFYHKNTREIEVIFTEA